jgi:hypothetical protein
MRTKWSGGALALIYSAIAVPGLLAQEKWDISITDVFAASSNDGVVVTSAARQAVLTEVAEGFGAEAIAAGFDPADVSTFSQAILKEGYITTVPGGLIGQWDSGKVEIPLKGPAQYQAIENTLSPKAVFMQIRHRPIVKIVVNPVPPRDYVVEINGVREKTTELSAYRVDAGKVAVRVTRANKPPCTWEDELTFGEEKEIPCDL